MVYIPCYHAELFKSNSTYLLVTVVIIPMITGEVRDTSLLRTLNSASQTTQPSPALHPEVKSVVDLSYSRSLIFYTSTKTLKMSSTEVTISDILSHNKLRCINSYYLLCLHRTQIRCSYARIPRIPRIFGISTYLKPHANEVAETAVLNLCISKDKLATPT